MGFQRQLCEFEKLLSLKKSYSSPNRVDKVTAAKLVGGQGGSFTFSHNGKKISQNLTAAKDSSVLKSLSVIKGPSAAANHYN